MDEARPPKEARIEGRERPITALDIFGNPVTPRDATAAMPAEPRVATLTFETTTGTTTTWPLTTSILRQIPLYARSLDFEAANISPGERIRIVDTVKRDPEEMLRLVDYLTFGTLRAVPDDEGVDAAIIAFKESLSLHALATSLQVRDLVCAIESDLEDYTPPNQQAFVKVMRECGGTANAPLKARTDVLRSWCEDFVRRDLEGMAGRWSLAALTAEGGMLNEVVMEVVGEWIMRHEYCGMD